MKIVESIRLYHKKLFNIEYHNRRFNRTRKELFGIQENANLYDLIQIPENITEDLYKCRLIYAEKILSVEFIPYIKRKIESLELIEDNDIDYSFKYLDKSALDKLKENCKADDILIVKNGFITDTSFSNIVFFDGTTWFTPSTCLLIGTKRSYLLESGQIFETEIRVADTKKYKYAMPINAMLDFEDTPYIKVDDIY
jgi:4-amino-4-deoxychorismate lyase